MKRQIPFMENIAFNPEKAELTLIMLSFDSNHLRAVTLYRRRGIQPVCFSVEAQMEAVHPLCSDK